MANQEQFGILKQSVQTWNQWRAENPGLQIVLRDANLDRAIVVDFDLSQVRTLRRYSN